MTELNGFSAIQEAEAADSETADTPKRRGRPPGSRNKIGKGARALIATEGLAGIRMACRIAAGRVLVFNDVDRDTGFKRKLVPTTGDMLTAQRLLLERLVPALKSSELTGADGSSLFPANEHGEPVSNRKLAMSVLQLLREARPDVAEPDEAGPLNHRISDDLPAAVADDPIPDVDVEPQLQPHEIRADNRPPAAPLPRVVR